MSMDLFDFWAGLPGHAHIHPKDEPILDRLKGGHRLELDCLPAFCMGPLKTARVVLLYSSPGFHERDLTEARRESVQAYYFSRRQGHEPLPKPEASGGKWWISRTRCFGNWQDLQSKIAVLNIGAYHSVEAPKAEVLAALPSSRISIGWAQDVLFPEAIAGRKIVVCLRSATFWGLTIQDGPFGRSLFAPPVTRGGHMRQGETRRRIEVAVKEMLGL